MNLFSWLFSEDCQSVALVGGGGKTSILTWAARSGSHRKLRLLLSTSTKLQKPAPIPDAKLHIGESLPGDFFETWEGKIEKPVLWVASATGDGLKWCAPPLGEIEAVISRQKSSDESAFYFLVESDGSAGRPIKAPGEREPVIPTNIHSVVALVGLSGLGLPVSASTVHRLDSFVSITNRHPGDLIDAEIIYCLLNHPLGIFKNTPESARRLVLFNQFDTVENADPESSERLIDFRRREFYRLLNHDYESLNSISSVAYASLVSSDDILVI